MLKLRYFLYILVALGILVVPLAIIGAINEDEHVDPATWDANGYASHVGVDLGEANTALSYKALPESWKPN